ncbi:MAG: hypothetical protein AAF629_21670 [Chloroflexota bacterium]
MTIFSLHEHELRPDIDEEVYKRDVATAIAKLRVPGLKKAYHVQGFKGKREQKYGVLWIFESEAAIVANFGTPENPKWPEDWLHYENDILAKYLDRHPDTIDFTAYQLLIPFEFD